MERLSGPAAPGQRRGVPTDALSDTLECNIINNAQLQAFLDYYSENNSSCDNFKVKCIFQSLNHPWRQMR